MGCCTPEYRKVVNEKEEEINQKGKDSLPLLLKLIIFLVTAGSVSAIYFM